MADVVIADDEVANRMCLALHLQMGDHAVRAASDGDEAVRLVEQATPDLVILDLHMPRLDGIETCALLRSLPQMATVPIILLSGADHDELRDRQPLPRFDAMRAKPYDMYDLWRLVAQLTHAT
ncbi:MAG: response regulator [Armatimonadetes bacterium]|nr:response regulator [Armatimonadota bacterium]